MHVVTRLEEIFGVSLEQHGRGDYEYTSQQITEDQVRQAVTAGTVELQDPDDITCGNNDGIAYVIVYVRDADDEVWDFYVGINLNDKQILVS